MTLVVITPPAALADAAYARSSAPVFQADDDDRVNALLQVAQAAIEPPTGWVGRAFGVQTLEVRFRRFPAPVIPLPCPPLREIVSLTYTDDSGIDRVLPADQYVAVGIGSSCGGIGRISGTSWPAIAVGLEVVRIRFEAGYDADNSQILPVKQAIVLAATHLRSLSTRELSLSSRNVDGAGSRSWVVSDAAEKLVRNAVESLLMPFKVFT